MIGALRGRVISRQGDVIIFDVNGVGYELTVTSKVLAHLTEEEQTLRVYTDVREQAICLFGFFNLLEKEVFQLLRKVKGIGPKASMTIVSHLGAEGVLASIGRSDIEAFKQVPGVGKKTAERMIVELRESVEGYLETDLVSAPVITRGKSLSQGITVEKDSAESGGESDVVLALEKLGFSKASAKEAVQAAKKSSGATSTGELLRISLASLHQE